MEANDKCPQCNQDIPSCDSLEEHILWTHHVKCGKCEGTFVSESKLDIHVKFDHVISGGDRTETECAACNFVFPTKKTYTLHLSGLQHGRLERDNHFDLEAEDDSDDEDFIDDCNFCGKILYSYDALDDHQANNIRCETCKICYHNEFQSKYHSKCDI